MQSKEKLVQKYIGDQLALEKHMLEAAERQVKDTSVKDIQPASAILEKVHRTLNKQVKTLENFSSRKGGKISSAAKESVTSLTGILSALYSKVRSEKVSKILRDHYAALSFATCGYTMLHTTALAVNDQETADLAIEHLKQLTPLLVEVSETIPEVIVRELTNEGFSIDSSAGKTATSHTREAWSGDHVQSGNP